MKSLAFWLRVVGFFAFLYVFSVYGPAIVDVTTRMTDQSWAAWIGALGLYLLALWCSALRLRAVAMASRVDLTSLDSFVMILKSTTLNTFFVSGAGEIYKTSAIAVRSGRTALSGGIVAFERIFGALTQLAFGLSMLIAFQRMDLIPTGTGTTLVIIAAILSSAWAAAQVRSAPAPMLAEISTGMFSVFHSAKTLAVLLCSSILLILCLIGSTCLLAYGAGLEIISYEFLYAVPLVTFATLIPITFGGIGVREAGYLWMFKSSLVTSADCVALGLSQYLVFLAVALLGGTLFLVGARMPSPHGANRVDK